MNDKLVNQVSCMKNKPHPVGVATAAIAIQLGLGVAVGCTTNSACCKMGGKLASVYRSETDLLLQIPLNASVREYKRLYISAGTRGELCGCCGSEHCSWQSCLWCCCRSGPRAEKNPAGDDLNCAGRICSQCRSLVHL